MKGAFGNEGALHFSCELLGLVVIVSSKTVRNRAGRPNLQTQRNRFLGFVAFLEILHQAADGRTLDFFRNSGSTFSTNASAVTPCFFRRIGIVPCSMN